MANKKNIDELLAEAESTQIQELKKDNLKLLKQLDKAKLALFIALDGPFHTILFLRLESLVDVDNIAILPSALNIKIVVGPVTIFIIFEKFASVESINLLP